jgi:hypothetical protein
MTTRADELLVAYDALAAHLSTPARDRDLVRSLAIRAGWGARPLHAPLLPSGISHGVPWELSCVAGSKELRVFVEAQADPPSADAYWRAADAVTDLAASHGADVSRLRAWSANLPTTLPRPARLWHAIALPPDGPIRWHAYITCPDALEVLRRADLTPPPLRANDRITIVSLDLAPRPRVKAYVVMPNATPDDLAVHSPDGPMFARAMLGDAPAPWWLVAIGLGAESATALHFPARHLDAATARARTRVLVTELADDDLHYVSFQRRAGVPRITTYFTPRVQR